MTYHLNYVLNNQVTFKDFKLIVDLIEYHAISNTDFFNKIDVVQGLDELEKFINFTKLYNLVNSDKLINLEIDEFLIFLLNSYKLLDTPYKISSIIYKQEDSKEFVIIELNTEEILSEEIVQGSVYSKLSSIYTLQKHQIDVETYEDSRKFRLRILI